MTRRDASEKEDKQGPAKKVSRRAAIKSAATALGASAFGLTVSGCGFRGEVQPAVDEVGRVRQQVKEISDQWNGQADRFLKEVKKIREIGGVLAQSVADFLETGVTQAQAAADHVVQQARTAATKVLQDAAAATLLVAAYLKAEIEAKLAAVSEALVECEEKIKQGNKPTLAQFQTMIQVAGKKQKIYPKVGPVAPREITMIWDNPQKRSFKMVDATIEICGYGFDQDHVKSALVVRLDNAVLPKDAVLVASDYLVRINLLNAPFANNIEAKNLKLLWKMEEEEKELCRWEVNWYRMPLNSPQAITLTLSPDGKRIQKIEPSYWDFGMAPSYAELIRGTNSREAIKTSGSINFEQIGIRNDDIGLFLKWKGADIRNNSFESTVKFRIVKAPELLRTETVTLGTYPRFTPRWIRGDDNFWGKIRYHVEGESRLADGKLQVRVYMFATEIDDQGRDQKDHTTVESWSDWRDAYVPPPGWKIKIAQLKRSTLTGQMRETDDQPAIKTMPAGEGVASFKIWGVKAHGKAGTETTSMEVTFNPVVVALEPQ